RRGLGARRRRRGCENQQSDNSGRGYPSYLHDSFLLSAIDLSRFLRGTTKSIRNARGRRDVRPSFQGGQAWRSHDRGADGCGRLGESLSPSVLLDSFDFSSILATYLANLYDGGRHAQRERQANTAQRPCNFTHSDANLRTRHKQAIRPRRGAFHESELVGRARGAEIRRQRRPEAGGG